jgi:hypothetical protein
MDKELEIRHGRKPAQPIAISMRDVLFEAMMAVSIFALIAALATMFWQIQG